MMPTPQTVRERGGSTVGSAFGRAVMPTMKLPLITAPRDPASMVSRLTVHPHGKNLRTSSVMLPTYDVVKKTGGFNEYQVSFNGRPISIGSPILVYKGEQAESNIREYPKGTHYLYIDLANLLVISPDFIASFRNNSGVWFDSYGNRRIDQIGITKRSREEVSFKVGRGNQQAGMLYTLTFNTDPKLSSKRLEYNITGNHSADGQSRQCYKYVRIGTINPGNDPVFTPNTDNQGTRRFANAIRRALRKVPNS